MQALRTLSSMAQGRANRGLVGNLPTGLHLMRLEGTSDIVWVAWNSQPNTTISLRAPAGGLLAVSDCLGAPRTGTASGSQRVYSLVESDGPIYLSYTR